MDRHRTYLVSQHTRSSKNRSIKTTGNEVGFATLQRYWLQGNVFIKLVEATGRAGYDIISPQPPCSHRKDSRWPRVLVNTRVCQKRLQEEEKRSVSRLYFHDITMSLWPFFCQARYVRAQRVIRIGRGDCKGISATGNNLINRRERRMHGRAQPDRMPNCIPRSDVYEAGRTKFMKIIRGYPDFAYSCAGDYFESPARHPAGPLFPLFCPRHVEISIRDELIQ